MTGVKVHRLLPAVAGIALVVAATALAASSPLDKIVLTAAQVGPGYQRVAQATSRGTQAPTLDLCGYRFTSEAKRTDRLQVGYARPGSAIAFSNEVVTYAPGGTALAMRELNAAITHCPSGAVTSPGSGLPPLRYRVTRLRATGLLSGSLSFSMRIYGTVNGQPESLTAAIVYQVHGNRLSGVYAYGGTAAARNAEDLRVARLSAKNLSG
jgi:hypothetical protein